MGKAIVIGGSMAGLLAALLLRNQGWQVEVYERTGEELAGRGAGIVTHAELTAVMAAAGVDPHADLGVPTQTRRMLAADGTITHEIPLPQVFTAWDRLYHMLRDAFPIRHYQLGRTLDRVEQDAAGVTAIFADGYRDHGDLLIGADGIRSTVRALLAPQAQPRYAGYVAWRGLVAEAELPPAVHDAIFMHMAFCLPEGEQIVGYPVAGLGEDLRPGHRRYNFVWYRPADAATLATLLTDADGVLHEGSIPPPLISTANIAAMRDAAQRLLAPAFAEMVRLTPLPFLQPISDLISERIAFGRVALIGDAAFVARPHCGAGVTKAGLDAAALALALGREADVAKALLAYEAERLPVNTRTVHHAQKLGHCIAAGGPADPAMRTAEAILKGIATTDFLHAA